MLESTVYISNESVVVLRIAMFFIKILEFVEAEIIYSFSII